ncbi:MAG TPA: protein kinase [Vicinamibacterales bacterium]|nr:protein kinase [Vicinamibacterales bacterium]
MALVPGTRLGPYELVALLGRGGMGEVYRATDARIGRTVAIKILSADAARQDERRIRFEREARAVGRLNHPNICALYDVGSQDGVEYLVMEYLQGETLSSRLRRGPLPFDEALRHAAALAEAVARAHQEGIVHRDIKPSNVMLTDSGLKLLDFGLAKLRDQLDVPALVGDLSTVDGVRPPDNISSTGTIVGTFAYMAPEQLEGHPCDARTDLFSLGLVLFEMFTGRHPFAKTSEAEVVHAILYGEPESLLEASRNATADLDRAVGLCLKKRPQDRWQSAADLARDLAWSASGSRGSGTAATPATRRRRWLEVTAAAIVIVAAVAAAYVGWQRQAKTVRSLVVLPCTSANDSQAQAYCDGLADTLSAKIAPLVLARGLQLTSTFEVRQRGVANASAARASFGATLILEGAILRAGETMRINYALVDADSSRQLDAVSLTAAASDPFSVQDRVTEWAVTALELKLNGPEREALTAHETQVPGAHELYLQGRGYLLDYEKPGHVDTAIDLFTRAIALDAKYALAFAGVGSAYWQKYTATKDPSWVPLARDACDRALGLDAAAPAGYVCRGTVRLGTGEYTAAADDFARAVDREPTNDEAYLGLARAQQGAGNVSAAEQTYRRAVDLRPQYWATHEWLAIFYRDQARYGESVQQYQAAVSLTPDNARAYYALGGVYLLLGRYEDAIGAFRKSVSLGPTPGAYANWGVAYYYLRRFPESASMLEEACRLAPDARRLGNLARAYYWAGDKTQATVTFERAIADGERELAVNPHDVDLHLLMAEYMAKLGRRSESLAHLDAAQVAHETDPHRLFFAALAYNSLHDEARALHLLSQAVDRQLPPAELTAWPDLDNLRPNLSFQRLVHRVNQ